MSNRSPACPESVDQLAEQMSHTGLTESDQQQQAKTAAPGAPQEHPDDSRRYNGKKNKKGARKPAGLTVNTAAAAAVDGAQAPDSSAAGTNDQGPTSMNNLYLPALASHTTDEDLIQLCSKYGTIKSAKAIVDRVTGKCKGYGFVMFDETSAAQAALDGLIAAGHPAAFAKISYGDRPVQPGKYEEDPTNLYFSNLPIAMMEDDLHHMLAPYGAVVSSRILRDSNGQSRGVGFARMEDKQICEFIIRDFNCRLLPGATEPLQVKFADTPAARRKGRKGWRNQGNGGAPMSPYGMAMPMYMGPPGMMPPNAYAQPPPESPSTPGSMMPNMFMMPPPYMYNGHPYMPHPHAHMQGPPPQAMPGSPTFAGHMPPMHPGMQEGAMPMPPMGMMPVHQATPTD